MIKRGKGYNNGDSSLTNLVDMIAYNEVSNTYIKKFVETKGLQVTGGAAPTSS